MIQRQWERYRLSIQAQEGQKICCWPPLWSPCRGHSQKFQSQAVEVQGSWWAPLEAEGIIEWEWVLGRAWGQTKIGMRVIKEGRVWLHKITWENIPGGSDEHEAKAQREERSWANGHIWGISPSFTVTYFQLSKVSVTHPGPGVYEVEGYCGPVGIGL